MTVQEKKKKEEKSSDWRIREPQLTGGRQSCSRRPHGIVSGNPCCREAVMTRGAVTTLLHVCVCVHS